eukprot:GILK01012045.1.p1 GENE.GILK01012045.1~~GILK01012045.1.p1  ORF type:complete len:216 (-),score=24.85 GILK01012045.1:226-873(-)
MSSPDISHLTSADFKDIYEPAEDSFLFLDALDAERDSLQSLKGAVCVEIGSGSGIVITHLAKVLGPSNFYAAVDVNERAAVATSQTANQNKVAVEMVLSDLFSAFLPRLQQSVDILLMNPPYVPTPSEEVGSKDIAAAWAGGIDGREVIDRFLPCIPHILSARGKFYLLLVEANKPSEIVTIMNAQGYTSTVVLRRKAFNERLCVIRFEKNNASS